MLAPSGSPCRRVQQRPAAVNEIDGHVVERLCAECVGPPQFRIRDRQRHRDTLTPEALLTGDHRSSIEAYRNPDRQPRPVQDVLIPRKYGIYQPVGDSVMPGGTSRALRGDEKRAAEFPLCGPFLEPISPLRFPFNGIDLLYETARLNLPVPIGPMAQMGLSAPCSIAGTMAVENAEILAGVCITQLIRPGMPVCYGGICHAFDMSTTQMIFCGPEQAIFAVAMTQMGKHHGLPVYIDVGLTDSKRPDAQVGMEAGITLALGAAAGADIFGHMGICGVDQASSLDMLVLRDEIVGYVESTMRVVDFSDEALGLDIIEEVGPGGKFIDSMYTAEHFRQELWFPRLLDRAYYQAWLDAGAQSVEDCCIAQARKILADHQPEPLPADIEKAIAEIVATAKKVTSHE